MPGTEPSPPAAAEPTRAEVSGVIPSIIEAVSRPPQDWALQELEQQQQQLQLQQQQRKAGNSELV